MKKALHVSKLIFGLVLALVLLSTMNASAQTSPFLSEGWVITKTQWSATDERNYSAFVQAIGDSGCNTIDSCIKSPANPYRATDPAGVTFWSDCAKLPYLLRTYFAWKNGLPFSYVNEVATADGAGANLRYSPRGNRVLSRRDLVSQTGKALAPIRTLNMVLDDVMSAMFRYDPRTDTSLATDFYPVKITRDTVRPGAIIYDPNGHVAVVYKIESDGRVRFIDAHPDNSLTRGVYGKKFARSSPGMGAGFKNWRPLTLVGATRAADGRYLGGRIVPATNAHLADYGVEQFFGTQPSPDGSWQKGRFEWNGQALDYYDFVRTRLASGSLRYRPVEELKNMLTALCDDLKDRVAAVQTTIDKGIAAKPHPEALPENIYGTSGEWESYSTPSRDARLKTSFKELRDRAAEFLELTRQGSPRIDYQGANLRADLLAAYEETSRACRFEYVKSDGAKVALDLEEAAGRLFAMSFDPYHCPELRWGATTAGELSSCRDSRDKLDWYRGEARLRNQIDRTYDVRMGFTLDQLLRRAPGSGVDQAPDTDVRALLKGAK
jgi:hypothetical protein